MFQTVLKIVCPSVPILEVFVKVAPYSFLTTRELISKNAGWHDKYMPAYFILCLLH